MLTDEDLHLRCVVGNITILHGRHRSAVRSDGGSGQRERSVHFRVYRQRGVHRQPTQEEGVQETHGSSECLCSYLSLVQNKLAFITCTFSPWMSTTQGRSATCSSTVRTAARPSTITFRSLSQDCHASRLLCKMLMVFLF